MDYVIHYDICAAIMLAVNTLFFFSKKHLWDRQSKFYCSILILSFLGCLLDIGTVVVRYFAPVVPENLVWAANMAYLGVFHTIPPLMLFYFWELVDELNTLKRFWKIASWIPYGITTALIISSPWTGAIFYVDENNIYRHGPLHILYYISSAIMIIMCARIIIVYRDKVDVHKRSAAVAFIVLILIAMVIQGIFEPLLLVHFAAAIALMMMYLALQEPNSHIDPLTNALNRAGMMQLTNELFLREKRFSILAFGIDDFKKVNGVFGDKHGDKILSAIVDYLAKRYRFQHIARIGGDWICVLLSGEHSTDELRRELAAFPDMWEVHGSQTPVSACRVALDSADYSTQSQMMLYLQYAQKAVKAKGSGTTLLVDNSTVKMYEREQKIKERLEQAVRDGSFEVYYQPIAPLQRDGKAHCVEALVRLYDSDLGFIPPSEFIPIAEKSDLICSVGDIVRRKVFTFIAEHDIRAAGIDHISINLSVIECMRYELRDKVLCEAEHFGIDPSAVCFEITESAAAMSMSVLRGNMQQLANDGFTFALDDYGTGYSNLAAILSLPFKVVKLDKSILYAADSESKQSYLRSLIGLFHSLNLEVVCEGVETDEQDDLIRACGTEYAQGYLYSRPLTADGLEQYASIPARSVTV